MCPPNTRTTRKEIHRAMCPLHWGECVFSLGNVVPRHRGICFGGVRPSSGPVLGRSRFGRGGDLIELPLFGAETLLLPRTAALRTLPFPWVFKWSFMARYPLDRGA